MNPWLTRSRPERASHAGAYLGAQGQTPVIQFHFNWTHISVIAGLSRTNCLFRLYEGSIKKEQHVEFLKALRAHLKRPLLIVWDGLRAHRSKLVRDYLDSTDGLLQMAFLPPYSPAPAPAPRCRCTRCFRAAAT